MDPNANLEEIRRLVAEFNSTTKTESDPLRNHERLVDLIEALDGWLSKGGFLPDAWKRP